MSKKTDLTSFRILETIQESKRFIIYKAEAFADQSRVVIKTTIPAAASDEALKVSLKKEAEAGIKLQHPYIRRGLSFLEDAGHSYLVAEYSDGISLGRYLLSYPAGVSYELGLLWATNIADALAFAQRQAVNHLNLNPYNIIISPTNQLRIIGFGKERKAWKHSEGNFKFHFPVLYIPVEEFKGSLIHPNSDLYSWAVITYQMLTGTVPWRVDSFMSPEEQKEQCLTRAVQQPEVNKIPDWLYSIILDCLKLDPNDRIKNPAILSEALKAEGKFTDYIELEDLAEQAMHKAEWLQEMQETEAEEPEEEAAEIVALPVLESEAEAEIDIADAVEPEELTTEEEPVAFPLAETLAALPEDTPPDQALEPEAVAIDDESEPELPAQVTIETDETAGLPLEQDPVEIPQEQPQLDESDPASEEDNPLERLKQILAEEPKRDAYVPDTEPPEKEELFHPEPEECLETEPIEDAELAESAPIPEAHQPALAPVQSMPEPEPQPEAIKPEMASYAPQRSYKEDLSGVQKTFRILMYSSLIIVLFLAARYFLTRDKNAYKLPQLQNEVVEEAPEAPILKENRALEMVLVAADTLVMGNISPEADDDEFPLLTIGLRSFLISRTEVTQEEWLMVFAQNPSQLKSDKLPVENVSFYEAIDFCNVKSLKDGLTPAYDVYGSEIICDFDADGYRLPTEAEWELAAKSGKGNAFELYSGSTVPEDIAWFNANSGARTRDVGSKQANQLGLYDMNGNVFEWVWNWYAPYTYRVTNLYSGPHSGTDKVIRGGSWYHGTHELRVTNREYLKPFAKNGYTGFRVVRSR